MGMRMARAGAALVAFAVAAAPAFAEVHRDERAGYQITYPAKWQSMPLDTTTSFVQARFLSNQEYYWEEGSTRDWGNHRPWIDVVVIPLAASSGGATVEQTEKGIRVREDLPYRDLKDYLDQFCRRLGGFHFTSETEVVIGGLKVRQYEILVDKLARGERLVYGWAWYTSDAIYGVVGEILRKEEKRLRPSILSAFQSMKFFPRKGTLPGTTRTGVDIDVVDAKPGAAADEKTPEQIEQERRDATTRALERIRQSLPRDWTISESRNFIAVSHADPKYTQKLLQHAEALRDWLEKNFAYWGSGYTGRLIIRICASAEEQSAYLESRAWASDTPELVTYQDRSGWSDWAMEWLNRGILDRWLRDKSPDLWWRAPQWATAGLEYFIEGARLKSGRLEFRADEWERDRMRVLAREGKLLEAQQFFRQTSEELFADWQRREQAGFFVSFLVAGSGRTGRFKNVFPDYVKNLLIYIQKLKDAEAAAAEAAAAGGGNAAAPPKTEEEENARFRAQQQEWRRREREMLDELVERTFEGWTAKDWQAFDAAYRRDAR